MELVSGPVRVHGAGIIPFPRAPGCEGGPRSGLRYSGCFEFRPLDPPCDPMSSASPSTTHDTEEARDRLRRARRVLALTVAGISAESGVPTFRGPQGLWRDFRPEDLAT